MGKAQEKPKEKKKRTGARKFTRAHFELITHKEALTVSKIIELHANGLIQDEDYLFTLDGLKKIADVVYKGAWVNCRDQPDPHTKWANEVKFTDARDMIRNAFTT